MFSEILALTQAFNCGFDLEPDLPPDRLGPLVADRYSLLPRIPVPLHAAVRLNYILWIQDIAYEDEDAFLATL